MKPYLISVLTILLVVLSPQRALANHFSCTATTTETTATLTVRTTQPGIFATQYVKIVDAANSTMDGTIAPFESIDQTADTSVYTYRYLDPGKTYKAVVYDRAGLFVEDIKGCTFTTKGGTTTPTQTPTTPNLPFRISIQDKTATSAKINAQSLLPFSTLGEFQLRKYVGQTASAQTQVSYCTSSTFASAETVQCIVTGLAPATRYLVIVIANGPDNRQYSAPMEFTTLAQTSTTPVGTGTNTGSPSPGSGNTGSPSPGQDSGIPMTTTGSGSVATTAGIQAGGLFEVKLKNPLKVNNISDAIKFFLDVLIKIAIPFIVIFFIWSGLKFILAQGNPTEITKAKKMFWYTIIGTLLILGAWTITNAVIGTINSIIN